MACDFGPLNLPAKDVGRCVSSSIYLFNRSNHVFLDKQFLPRDARSARAVFLSYVVTRPSARLSVRLSVTLMYHGHIQGVPKK